MSNLIRREFWTFMPPEYQAATNRLTQLRSLSPENPRHQEATKRLCFAAGRTLSGIELTGNVSERGHRMAEKVKKDLYDHQPLLEGCVKTLLQQGHIHIAIPIIGTIEDLELRRQLLITVLKKVNSEPYPESWLESIAKKFEEMGDSVEAQRVRADKQAYKEVIPQLRKIGKIVSSREVLLSLSVEPIEAAFIDPEDADSSELLTQLSAKKTASIFGMYFLEDSVLTRRGGINFYQDFINQILQEEVFFLKNANNNNDRFMKIMGNEVGPALQKSSYNEGNWKIKSMTQSINDRELTFIRSGWLGHAVTLVFKDDFLFVCNRGDKCVTKSGKAVVQQFKIDPKKMTPELAAILLESDLDSDEGERFIYEELPQMLSPNGQIEKIFTVDIKSSLQRVGNCSFTSFAQGVRTAGVLFCKDEAEQKEFESKYYKFLLDMGMKHLERHLEGLASGHPHFDRDFVEDASIAVLEKITLLRQKNVLTDEEYERLLTQYPKIGQLISNISNQSLIDAVEKAQKYFESEDAKRRCAFLFDQLLHQNPKGPLEPEIVSALVKIINLTRDSSQKILLLKTLIARLEDNNQLMNALQEITSSTFLLYQLLEAFDFKEELRPENVLLVIKILNLLPASQDKNLKIINLVDMIPIESYPLAFKLLILLGAPIIKMSKILELSVKMPLEGIKDSDFIQLVETIEERWQKIVIHHLIPRLKKDPLKATSIISIVKHPFMQQIHDLLSKIQPPTSDL